MVLECGQHRSPTFRSQIECNVAAGHRCEYIVSNPVHLGLWDGLQSGRRRVSHRDRERNSLSSIIPAASASEAVEIVPFSRSGEHVIKNSNAIACYCKMIVLPA